MPSRFIRSVTLKTLNMGHLIVIGNVEVFNVQWFLYNTSLPTFFKVQQRQRIFINFRQRLKASINTDKRRFKIQTSDMGSPLAGPLDSDWHFDSLCGSHLQSQRELQGCQLSQIIRETPDFKPFLPVSRFESDISRIIAEVCHFL